MPVKGCDHHVGVDERAARKACGLSDQGYTLIELLIVLLIISIVTTVTLFSIGRNENREMELFANEVTQMVSLAEEQAMLQPNVLGMSLTANHIQFASLAKDKATQQSVWLPLSDQTLGRHTIPDNIQISVQIAGSEVKLDHDAKAIPPIIISTNGDVTPFVMYVGKRGKKPQYVITADADGHVSSASVS